MSLAALIFDVDGTLAETEELHRRAFNETFEAFGLPWCWDRPLYRRLLDVTGGKERLRSFIDTEVPPGGEAVLDRIAQLHAAKTTCYAELVEAGEAVLRPGVGELLEDARRSGLSLGIATTTNPANVDSLLRATLGAGGPRMFQAIAAGDEAAHKKPAPDIYRLALQRLGIEAGRCLAFEDSRNGLDAALGAGLSTIVTPSVYTEHQDFSGALEVRRDLAGFRLERYGAGQARRSRA